MATLDVDNSDLARSTTARRPQSATAVPPVLNTALRSSAHHGSGQWIIKQHPVQCAAPPGNTKAKVAGTDAKARGI